MAPVEESQSSNPSVMSVSAIVYISILGTVLIMSFLILCVKLHGWGQKTRNTQQRRVYLGSRQRQLSVQGEPTIFVSPANLPPPPKYEAMAPPSYDEVMGVHYPSYQPGQQPITQPLTHALTQSTSNGTEPTPNNVTVNVTNNVNRSSDAPAVVTVTTEERRTSVAVRA